MLNIFKRPRKTRADEQRAEPVNPHPGRSCDQTCDATDAAHDYGVIFFAEATGQLPAEA